MKLHLPVRLFRSLMALMMSVPASLYAAYSAPTSITIPSGYSSVTVDALEDITVYGSDSSDVAFRLDGAALPEGTLVGDALSSSIMTQSAGSWYITSDSVDSLASLSFCNANSRLFKVYSNESLEISALKRLLFDTNEYSHTTYSNEGYMYYGGVVYGMDNSRISLTQNESVTFCGNSVSSSSGIYGALIYGGSNSNIFICENGSTSFSENTASSTDGSVCGGVIGGTFITLCGNESLRFTKNSVTSTLDYTTWASGGALYGSSITLRGNGSLMFCGNSVSSSHFAYGGAIDSFNGGVSLNGNGTLIFSKNTASSSLYDNAKGGAIYSYNGNVSLNGNGDVTISENSASSASQASLGGSIYVYGNLNIQNNDSVLFEKNAEITKGVYRLRSIYAEGSGKSVISFSSADGNSVEFRDSIYIADGATVNLNSDYTDEDGVGHKQAGDIVFTGAYAETHLNALLTNAEAGRVATAEEILNSRTSEVYALTNLYGGRLRVEDGAIYMGRGITAYENSGATVRVKNATLNHKGYDLTFKSGSMLELSGSNSIIGDVLMQDGSWLAFDGSETTGTTFMKGDLTFDGVSNISLSGYSNWSGQNEILLCVEGEFSGWDVDSLTIRNGDSSSVDIRWVNGGLLVLNYNAETFNPYINGDVTFTSHQEQLQEYCYYSSVEFEGNFSSSGGALNGEYDSRVALRRNGDVNFTSNTARYYGGAIYGSDISLIGNRAVTFTRNKASDYGCAQGGAIYGSKVNLSGNGNITFIGNSSEALDSDYLWADGGAIYGGSISLCGNKVVTFCSNIALSDLSDSQYHIPGHAIVSGGAIDGNNVGLCCNESVIFQDNCALANGIDSNAQGGAIYGNDIELNDNGSVIFCGNTALSDIQYHIPGHAIASGGALYATGDMNIRNNDSALFEKNVEITDGIYRLRSIHAEGSGNVISLSASDGKSIEFRDSIYIGDGATVELNADYTDASGVVHKQAGDIIFTGAYAETHLNELLSDANAGRVATPTEINNSRMSEVWTVTNLYGGRLCVEEGAIYRGCGITVHEGSDATVRVKDATLSHTGYDLIFNAGTTLELAGANSISGNVLMKEGSWLSFDGSESVVMSTLMGNLTFVDGVNVSLSDNADWSGKNEILMRVAGDISGWNETTLTIRDGAADISMIEGGWLVLNYDAETFNPYFKGDVTFNSHQNTLQEYSLYNSLVFENVFYYSDGGAIYGGDIVLNNNSSVIFRNNDINFSTYLDYPYGDEWTKKMSGAAIYGRSISFCGNDSLIFSRNEASCSIDTYHTYLDVTVKVEGGAIYGDSESSVSLIGNQNVSFNSNSAHAYTSVADRLFNYYSHRVNAKGGAISAFDVYFGNNGDIEFSENSSSVVLCGYDYDGEEVPVDSSTTYSYAEGGAIYGTNVDLQDNGSVTFRDNTVASTEGQAYAYGGAISGNNIALNSNDSVTFDGNTASAQSSSEAVAQGGAIYGTNVDLQDNGSVTFRDNTVASTEGQAYAYGGAIFGSNIDLRANESLSFQDNAVSAAAAADTGEAYARGGAIYGKEDIVINNNGSLTFSRNIASALDGSYGYTHSGGGAIFGYRDQGISLSGNETVTFSGNTASAEYNASGGAIDGGDVTLNGNGTVTFSGNTAASGGAICCDNDVTLNGNKTVIFSGNSTSTQFDYANGGAIWAWGNLSIRNNDSVLFEKNVEVTNGSYRLRSIYAYGLSLSAAQNKSIEIRDSVYLGSGRTVSLNADYTDENGVVHKQTGDIIFTGAYTETHLNDLLEEDGAGRVATAEEILNSRTSEVCAMTQLYGGRLCVEEGAIYQGYGITAMEGSNATVRVKDATLSHSGYDLTFHDGTSLEIDGVSSVSGNVNLLSGSFLNILANSTLNMGVESCMYAENGANIALGTDATLNLEGSFVAGDAVILELSDGAAVSRGVTTICNNGGKDVVQLDAVAFASGTMQKVKDAHVVVDSSEDTSITYQLENASVENRGSGKLTMTHENNSISSVSSAGGDVEILNVDSSDSGNILKLVSLELHESAVFGAYAGDTVSADAEACVQVSGSAVFGVGTTVNADLVLMDGCVLTMDDTVRMGSDLSINGTLTLDGDLLSLIQNAEIGMHFDLFVGIDNLYLNGVLFDSIALTDNMSASTYFIGLEDVPESERYYRLSYASETPGEGVLSVHVVSIPEPTTATLGILALAGLAARRRRRW